GRRSGCENGRDFEIRIDRRVAATGEYEFVVELINRRRREPENPASDGDATPFSCLDTLFDFKIDGRGDRGNSIDDG
uniref:Uncharacterized protein n=1 Tax=Cucumis melo TaxID=3656 RepID=A0A9I9EDS4_CUCME